MAMRLLRDMPGFLTNGMILIIMALCSFIKKLDLLKLRGKTDK